VLQVDSEEEYYDEEQSEEDEAAKQFTHINAKK
jgi:hypothetical protein